MTTMAEYVAARGITVEIVRSRGFQLDSEGWEHQAYVLKLTRTEDGTTAETPGFDYRIGMGVDWFVGDEPANILDSLVSDASCYRDAEDFEDFAASLGYDEDSRKAEKIYRACGEVAGWLAEFLGGDDELDRVAYDIERL